MKKLKEALEIKICEIKTRANNHQVEINEHGKGEVYAYKNILELIQLESLAWDTKTCSFVKKFVDLSYSHQETELHHIFVKANHAFTKESVRATIVFDKKTNKVSIKNAQHLSREETHLINEFQSHIKKGIEGDMTSECKC